MSRPGKTSTAELPEDDFVSHHAEVPRDISGGGFGTLLGPALRSACDNRLSEIIWFRTDWQRGGALTGTAVYRDDDERPRDVVVKLPVPPCERHWLVALRDAGDVVPTVFAHGEAVGGYDLAWVIMEKLAHGPLGSAWRGVEFDLLIEAAGRFYEAAAGHPLSGEPLAEDMEKRFEAAQQAISDNTLPDKQRWNRAIKKAQRHLKEWIAIWDQRPTDQWCHGDLHLANAMTRTPAPAGPALLFDFARTRVGNWVQDAVYFEHLFWARRRRLGKRKLCKLIAAERKRRGLPVEKDWARTAQVKRVFMAINTPAMLHVSGDAAHVAAALEILEREVG